MPGDHLVDRVHVAVDAGLCLAAAARFAVHVEVDPGAVRQRANETIFTSRPELEKRVEMTHYQELVPENACWSINSGFGDVETPVGNLYCVGSSSVKRSMGLTRCSYSVLRMMELMGINGRAG